MDNSFEVVRNAKNRIELRDEQASPDSLGKMEVRFSKFGQWYEIRSVFEGHFLERVMPGAFTKTIADNRDKMRSLFNHGFDPQIGQKVLGPVIDLREENDSPVMVVDLMNTSYNRDLEPGLRRGLYGSSMRMRVVRDEVDLDPPRSQHNPDGIPERSIYEVSVDEAGPVTFAANPGSTSAMRSGTDAYYEQVRTLDPQLVDSIARSITPILPIEAAPELTPENRKEEGAETNPPSEPQKHSGGLTPGERRQRLNPQLHERK